MVHPRHCSRSRWKFWLVAKDGKSLVLTDVAPKKACVFAEMLQTGKAEMERKIQVTLVWLVAMGI